MPKFKEALKQRFADMRSSVDRDNKSMVGRLRIMSDPKSGIPEKAKQRMLKDIKKIQERIKKNKKNLKKQKKI